MDDQWRVSPSQSESIEINVQVSQNQLRSTKFCGMAINDPKEIRCWKICVSCIHWYLMDIIWYYLSVSFPSTLGITSLQNKMSLPEPSTVAHLISLLCLGGASISLIQGWDSSWQTNFPTRPFIPNDESIDVNSQFSTMFAFFDQDKLEHGISRRVFSTNDVAECCSQLSSIPRGHLHCSWATKISLSHLIRGTDCLVHFPNIARSSSFIVHRSS